MKKCLFCNEVGDKEDLRKDDQGKFYHKNCLKAFEEKQKNILKNINKYNKLYKI